MGIIFTTKLKTSANGTGSAADCTGHFSYNCTSDGVLGPLKFLYAAEDVSGGNVCQTTISSWGAATTQVISSATNASLTILTWDGTDTYAANTLEMKAHTASMTSANVVAADVKTITADLA